MGRVTGAIALTFLLCTTSEAKNFALVMGGSAEEIYSTGKVPELERLAKALEKRSWEVKRLVGAPDFSPEGITAALAEIRKNAEKGDQIYLHVGSHGELRNGQHGLFCESPTLLRSRKIMETAKVLSQLGAQVAVVLDACYSGLENERALREKGAEAVCLVTTAPSDFVSYEVSWGEQLERLPDHDSFEEYFMAMRRAERRGIMEISSQPVPWARSFAQFFRAVDPELSDFDMTLSPGLQDLPLALSRRVLLPPVDSSAFGRLDEILPSGDVFSPEASRALGLAQEMNNEAAGLKQLFDRRTDLMGKLRENYRLAMDLKPSDFPGLPENERIEGQAFFRNLPHFDLDALGTLKPLTAERVQELAWLSPEQKKWFTWLLLRGGVVGDRLKTFFDRSFAEWKQLSALTQRIDDSYGEIVHKERDLFDLLVRIRKESDANPCRSFRL